MTTLLSRLRSGSRGITTLEEFSQALSMYNAYGADLWLGAPSGGYSQTLNGEPAEEITRSYIGYTRQAYRENGIVFACMLARMSVFSAARFRWQRMRDGAPSDTFGTPDLAMLDRPWPGGTTQDMLARMIQDADLAGNAFFTRMEGSSELIRLRPDWVDIVVQKRIYRGGVLGYAKRGYVYYQGGKQQCKPEDIVPFFPDEVAHFMPLPDPEASFRGMSWLTPVIREIQGDQQINRSKGKFFENGMTPNMVVKHPTGATPEKVKRFAEMLRDEHGGVENAYKTMNLYPGADVTVVGKDFRQMDLRAVQGAGETRIAAAAGVPPVIAGFSEGLQAATYSNYAQARRRFADGTVHPLWQNASGSVEPIVPRPGGYNNGADVRLWYDVQDVPFLREDAKDASEIAQQQATTIKTYVDAGFTPESAVLAVEHGDKRLLVHTGLVSVQLLPPGEQGGAAGAGEEPAQPPPAPPQRQLTPAPVHVHVHTDPGSSANGNGRGVTWSWERHNRPGDHPTAAALAGPIHAEAVEREKELTPYVQGLASEFGGEPAGLDFRLKTQESLERKINTDEEEKGISKQESADSIVDVNRYTITFPEGAYTQQSRAVTDRLERDGYTTSVKNYWQIDDPYQGINVKVYPADGSRGWELQFHTPKSHEVKEGTLHPLLDKKRVAPRSEHAALTEQMWTASATIPVPPGVETFV